MSYFFAFILICILIWVLFGESIKKWAQRRMIQKMEDAIRAQMGMPSSKEERRRKAGQQSPRNARQYSKNAFYTPGPNANAPSNQSIGSIIIPKEYAEDVEFTEYREFSQKATIISEKDPRTGRSHSRVVIESQISDVEYVEFKNTSSH